MQRISLDKVFLSSRLVPMGIVAGIALIGSLALGCGSVKTADKDEPSDDGTPMICPKLDEQPLVQPTVITQQGGQLNTQLVIREREHDCVPFLNATGNWVGRKMTLRTYGWPKYYGIEIDPENPNDPNTDWGFPGPTFVLNKASAEGADDGSAFSMELYNRMTPNVADETTCKPQTSGNGVTDTFPNCFHGDNTTNFHFHGFHVSPQPHQDYVLLALRPKGSIGEAMAMGRGIMVSSGNYSYALDPLIWQQAEGTHWYHPHKHGSTALQVLNGMSGTFKILGEFDTWLDDQFTQPLVDNVMVLQQLGEDTFFFTPGSVPPSVVVNGQPTPIVTMKQGEIQRWRFIGATMQASAQLTISFTPIPVAQRTGGSLQVKQIAQDGVRFADANYQSQPLLTTGTANFNLAPGNRADFLVKAPIQAGRYALTQRVFANLGDDVRKLIESNRQRVTGLNARATAGGAPLLYIDVTDETQDMSFPATLPAMPSYLNDITSVDSNRTVAFQMTGNPGAQANSFQIDGKAYDPDCADQTLQLGQAEEWTVTNDSNPLHPFHIHVNPFQVLDRGAGATLPQPWIWQDTIALPAATVSTAGTTVSTVTLRQRYDNYTGEYVLHCHFLGHEDRGMMQNVQTVCPENSKYGKPLAGQPECVAGNYVLNSPAPQCAVPTN